MYERVLKSTDYQQLLKAEEPCPCGSKSKLKECHSLDLDGVLSRSKHPDGDSCPFCPYCITLPALTQLGKIANHLELIKPDEAAMTQEAFDRQAAFARMALSLPDACDVRRNRTFENQAHSKGCGKMRALEELLRRWKREMAKVLLFSQVGLMAFDGLDCLG